MFNAYLSLGELGKAIEGRELVKRQREYGFFGASALSVARVAGDLPLIVGHPSHSVGIHIPEAEFALADSREYKFCYLVP